MTSPACRLCGADLHRSFLDLGATPLASVCVTPAQAAAGLDSAFPLHVRVCDACLLVQVASIAPPAGTVIAIPPAPLPANRVEQAQRYAGAMIERFSLRHGSQVMQVASEGGNLLRHFLAAGIPVLGIEPAPEAAAAARRIGIPTEAVGFNAETAMQIAAHHGRADLVIANDVLARVTDLFGFAAGFTAILRPNGVATFEFAHLLSLIATVQFDAISHERCTYLSLLVVEHVLRSVGLRIFDAEQLPTHGGSLRIFSCHVRAPFSTRPAPKAIRALETAAGLAEPELYSGFGRKVTEAQRGFLRFLTERKAMGRHLAAYGAASRGNTLLNSCGVTTADILCVADRNPAKQGRLLPGSHVPIVAPEALLAAPPDDLLILPWHLAGEIAAELKPLREAGTEFWIALPSVQRV